MTEEMAIDIAKRDCSLWECCPKEPKHNCVSQDPEIMLESSKNYITIATWLVNAGYRKIPENAVVLTNDEFWALSNKFSKKELDEIVEFHKKKTRKETAEKFVKGFINDILPKIMNGHNEKALQIAMAMTNYCQEITEGKV